MIAANTHTHKMKNKSNKARNVVIQMEMSFDGRNHEASIPKSDKRPY